MRLMHGDDIETCGRVGTNHDIPRRKLKHYTLHTEAAKPNAKPGLLSIYFYLFLGILVLVTRFGVGR